MNKADAVKVIMVLLVVLFLPVMWLPVADAQTCLVDKDTLTLENSGLADESDEDYDEEMNRDELPESIKASVDDAYHGYEIQRVYRSKASNYKIEVENGNEKAVVYFDADGKFLKAEDHNNQSFMQD